MYFNLYFNIYFNNISLWILIFVNLFILNLLINFRKLNLMINFFISFPKSYFIRYIMCCFTFNLSYNRYLKLQFFNLEHFIHAKLSMSLFWYNYFVYLLLYVFIIIIWYLLL